MSLCVHCARGTTCGGYILSRDRGRKLNCAHLSSTVAPCHFTLFFTRSVPIRLTDASPKKMPLISPASATRHTHRVPSSSSSSEDDFAGWGDDDEDNDNDNGDDDDDDDEDEDEDEDDGDGNVYDWTVMDTGGEGGNMKRDKDSQKEREPKHEQRRKI